MKKLFILVLLCMVSATVSAQYKSYRLTWPDGKTKHSYQADELGNKHGREIIYNPKGILTLDCNWNHGKPHGESKTYDTYSGALEVHQKYDNGILLESIVYGQRGGARAKRRHEKFDSTGETTIELWETYGDKFLQVRGRKSDGTIWEMDYLYNGSPNYYEERYKDGGVTRFLPDKKTIIRKLDKNRVGYTYLEENGTILYEQHTGTSTLSYKYDVQTKQLISCGIKATDLERYGWWAIENERDDYRIYAESPFMINEMGLKVLKSSIEESFVCAVNREGIRKTRQLIREDTSIREPDPTTMMATFSSDKNIDSDRTRCNDTLRYLHAWFIKQNSQYENCKIAYNHLTSEGYIDNKNKVDSLIAKYAPFSVSRRLPSASKPFSVKTSSGVYALRNPVINNELWLSKYSMPHPFPGIGNHIAYVDGDVVELGNYTFDRHSGAILSVKGCDHAVEALNYMLSIDYGKLDEELGTEIQHIESLAATGKGRKQLKAEGYIPAQQ